MKYDKIIFVAQSGNSREPMAAGILKDMIIDPNVEILARGLVVQFPEPMNQKAEAILISNGIDTTDFVSEQFSEAEVTANTIIFAMETVYRDRIIDKYPSINPDQVHVLSEFVGDELEVLDPYGGQLPNYGLCYESLRVSLKKFLKIINEGE